MKRAKALLGIISQLALLKREKDFSSILIEIIGVIIERMILCNIKLKIESDRV